MHSLFPIILVSLSAGLWGAQAATIATGDQVMELPESVKQCPSDSEYQHARCVAEFAILEENSSLCNKVEDKVSCFRIFAIGMGQTIFDEPCVALSGVEKGDCENSLMVSGIESEQVDRAFDCKSEYSDDKDVHACILGVARQQPLNWHLAKICSLSPHSIECYQEIAQQDQDITYCDLIGRKQEKEKCKRAFVETMGEDFTAYQFEKCDSDDCRMDIAEASQDVALCKDMNSGNNATACYARVGVALQDATVCDSLRHWSRDQCFQEYANLTSNSLACLRIEGIGSKHTCLRQAPFSLGWFIGFFPYYLPVLLFVGMLVWGLIKFRPFSPWIIGMGIGAILAVLTFVLPLLHVINLPISGILMLLRGTVSDGEISPAYIFFIIISNVSFYGSVVGLVASHSKKARGVGTALFFASTLFSIILFMSWLRAFD